MVEADFSFRFFGSDVARTHFSLSVRSGPPLDHGWATSLGMIRNSARDPQTAILQEWSRRNGRPSSLAREWPRDLSFCRAMSGRVSSEPRPRPSGTNFFFSRNDSKLGTGSSDGNPAGMVEEKWTSEKFGSGVAGRPLLLPGHVRPWLERTPATTLGNEIFFFPGMIRNSARDP